MQHEEHSHSAKRFGTNTNGLGIFIVVIVAVCLALFCWNFWKDGKKEIEHYRITGVATEGHETAHGEGTEHATAHEAAAPELVNPASVGTLDTATGNFILNVGDNVIITLPDSAKTTLQVGANSTEAKLFHFLSDAANTVDTVDKTKGWITCDRIYFETGKANLTADSKKQIHNIALILKAFPAADLKIGGYTDNTGSAEVNTKLSNDRAATVLSAVKAAGGSNVGNGLTAEGYGPEHPIASNDNKEGQALNRRVDLRVTKK